MRDVRHEERVSLELQHHPAEAALSDRPAWAWHGMAFSTAAGIERGVAILEAGEHGAGTRSADTVTGMLRSQNATTTITPPIVLATADFGCG